MSNFIDYPTKDYLESHFRDFTEAENHKYSRPYTGEDYNTISEDPAPNELLNDLSGGWHPK